MTKASPPEMAPKNDIYELPGELGMALTTERGLFARMLAKKITAKTKVNPTTYSELCRLVGDLIDDKHELKLEIESLEEKVSDLETMKTKIRGYVDGKNQAG